MLQCAPRSAPQSLSGSRRLVEIEGGGVVQGSLSLERSRRRVGVGWELVVQGSGFNGWVGEGLIVEGSCLLGLSSWELVRVCLCRALA
jgi:hypothetical protein